VILNLPPTGRPTLVVRGTKAVQVSVAERDGHDHLGEEPLEFGRRVGRSLAQDVRESQKRRPMSTTVCIWRQETGMPKNVFIEGNVPAEMAARSEAELTPCVA
jgi:hypothetical protein